MRAQAETLPNKMLLKNTAPQGELSCLFVFVFVVVVVVVLLCFFICRIDCFSRVDFFVLVGGCGTPSGATF